MKSTYILIIYLILFSCCGSKVKGYGHKDHVKPKNDLGESGLIGNVKSYTELEYEMNENGGTKFFDSFAGEFNRNGFFIEESHGGLFTEKRLYKYDQKGNVVEVRVYGSDGRIQRIDSTFYGSNQKEIKKVRYDKNNKQESEFVPVYDAQGKEVKLNTYVNGSLKFVDIIFEDGNENSRIDSTFDNGGALLKVTTESYNPIENEYIHDTFRPNKMSHFELVDKLDDHDLIIESYSLLNNPAFRNNPQNNVPDNKSTYTYENYDNAGNWLVKKTYEDGKLKYESKRTISYY